MPGRRHIRETTIQFLYSVDLEGATAPATSREAFWKFITESDRSAVNLATFKTLLHFTQGRDDRLLKFIERVECARPLLAANPEFEPMRRTLERIIHLESSWSESFGNLARLAKCDENTEHLAESLSKALQGLVALNRDLTIARAEFLEAADNHPSIRGRLEPIISSITRLEKISQKVQMATHPQDYPEQADLKKLRESTDDIEQLRIRVDQLVDGILSDLDEIDTCIAKVVENYTPERIDPVDKAILRLAIHESKSNTTPTKVIINEAIELAKRFGTSQSGRFVNGILDKAIV